MIPVMKAQTLREGKDDDWWDRPDVVADEKLDGHWCELEAGERWNTLYSSLGNDISEQHPWLRDLKLPQGLIVVGEIRVPGGSSNMTNGDVDRAVFTMFDFLATKTKPYAYMSEEWSRRAELDNLVLTMDCVRLSVPRRSRFDKRRFYEEIIEAGGEGVVLKDMHAPYQPGKRSPYWRKRKAWITVDVVIVGCDAPPTMWTVKPGHYGTDGVFYPEGKPSEPALKGWKNLEYGYWDPVRNAVVKVGSLGYTGPPDELRQHVGVVAEVKCAGVYTSGAMRHPTKVIFRGDKAAHECTLAAILASAGSQVIKVKGG